MTTLIYNDIAFIAENIVKIPEAEFVKGHDHLGLTSEQLKEVHKLAKESIKASPKKEDEKPKIEVLQPGETSAAIQPSEKIIANLEIPVKP